PPPSTLFPYTTLFRSLVLAIVQDAAAAGAIVANHVEVEGLVRQGGRVAGARLRDSIAGASFGVSARFPVNATGVWLDHVRNPRRSEEHTSELQSRFDL